MAGSSPGSAPSSAGSVPKTLVAFPYTRMLDAHEGLFIFAIVPPVIVFKAVVTVSTVWSTRGVPGYALDDRM